jgi:hypothetical protein
MKRKLLIVPNRQLEELLDQISCPLERLQQRALLLNDRDAARELLLRASEILQRFGPVLVDAPELLAEDAVTRLDMPVPLALSRSHRYYYKRIIHRLHKLKLGSKTGIACHERANWKSAGSVGAWAVLLYNIVEALRTNGATPDPTTEAFVLQVKRDHRSIAEAASRLPKFGPESVEDWIKTACSPILYIFRLDLKPAKRGKRKRTDQERADPRAKRERDAIVQRIRAMVAGPGKSRSYKSRL